MELFKREKYLQRIRPFFDADDIIKVITGVRRCGKSSLMQTIAEEILARGTPENNIVFLDLDKRGFRSIKTADQLDSLIESKTCGEGKKYLFIDEVQNVEGFEEVINGYRSDGGYSIFITGSNSYLLSGELVTKLTGRFLEFELFPLSFDEYLEIKRFYKKPVNANSLAELNTYILEGGFPRTVFIDDSVAKKTYVNGVVDEIFEKDIRRRVKVKDIESLKSVRNYIISNFGAVTSINSLHQALLKNGMRIGRATVSRYIQILLDAKILYECPRFDIKSKRSLAGDKKYYLSDLSFYYASNTDNRVNFGPALENIVFIYAKSMRYSVSVGRIGKTECDFILRSCDNDYSYIQVAYTIMQSRETEEREYRALESIRDNYRKYLVTTDAILQKRNGILHVNLMDFIGGSRAF